MIRVVFGVFCLSLCLVSHASAIPVNIIDSEYTTSLYKKANANDQDDDNYSIESMTRVSSSPLHDEMYFNDSLVAAAQADSFSISAYTRIGGHPDNVSIASSKTELAFSPIASSVTMFQIDFYGYAEWYYSNGFVSLSDVSTGQELWNYYWTDSYVSGNVPWVDDFSGPYRAWANIDVETILNQGANYLLTIYTQTCSNPADSELIRIDVSGVESIDVPESSLLIVSLIHLLIFLLFQGRRRLWNR